MLGMLKALVVGLFFYINLMLARLIPPWTYTISIVATSCLGDPVVPILGLLISHTLLFYSPSSCTGVEATQSASCRATAEVYEPLCQFLQVSASLSFHCSAVLFGRSLSGDWTKSIMPNINKQKFTNTFKENSITSCWLVLTVFCEQSLRLL